MICREKFSPAAVRSQELRRCWPCIELTGTELTGAFRTLSMAAAVGCQEVTEPGVSVHSSSDPTVIFPMRKSRPPRFERLWPGHVGGDTKITLPAITVVST
jgi:hypothetical protein